MTQPVESPSGLIQQDLIVGRGALAADGAEIRVHYVGKMLDGAQFDSSRNRCDPLDFEVGSGLVIAGLDQGVRGMRVGGVRKLTIPAALAYGDQGCGGVIPPGATIVFDVELLEVA
ncbi:MAG TPA: FKBP-type peptidyl-prolyl cis-trans isomerase [Burkholderiales bacterium]|nr:FKBP-type peptidyl-prolyl cis-trans isomerase [Burkholderiales bacterium]